MTVRKSQIREADTDASDDSMQVMTQPAELIVPKYLESTEEVQTVTVSSHLKCQEDLLEKKISQKASGRAACSTLSRRQETVRIGCSAGNGFSNYTGSMDHSLSMAQPM